MFGLFKKPNATETTNQCIDVWNVLTERDKSASAKYILIYAKYLADNCDTGTEAIFALARLKQEHIKNYSLRDHFHPAFMQVQILNDYIFTHKNDKSQHSRTARALALFTSPLGSEDKEDLSQYLERLVLNPIPKGPLKKSQQMPKANSATSKIVRECPRCSQKCRVINQKTQGNLIEITCPTCTLQWTTLS